MFNVIHSFLCLAFPRPSVLPLFKVSVASPFCKSLICVSYCTLFPCHCIRLCYFSFKFFVSCISQSHVKLLLYHWFASLYHLCCNFLYRIYLLVWFFVWQFYLSIFFVIYLLLDESCFMSPVYLLINIDPRFHFLFVIIICVFMYSTLSMCVFRSRHIHFYIFLRLYVCFVTPLMPILSVVQSLSTTFYSYLHQSLLTCCPSTCILVFLCSSVCFKSARSLTFNLSQGSHPVFGTCVVCPSWLTLILVFLSIVHF